MGRVAAVIQSARSRTARSRRRSIGAARAARPRGGGAQRPAVAEIGDPPAAEPLLQLPADPVRGFLGRAAQHQGRRRVAAGADRAAGRPQRPIDEGVGNEGDAFDPALAALAEPMPGGVGRLAPRAGADAEVRRGGDAEDFRRPAAALDGLRRDDGDLETGADQEVLGNQDSRHAAGNLGAIMHGDDDRARSRSRLPPTARVPVLGSIPARGRRRSSGRRRRCRRAGGSGGQGLLVQGRRCGSAAPRRRRGGWRRRPPARSIRFRRGR